MKEKLIISCLILIYSELSTEIIKKNAINTNNFYENRIEILVAQNLWDYLSRFSLN